MIWLLWAAVLGAPVGLELYAYRTRREPTLSALLRRLRWAGRAIAFVAAAWLIVHNGLGLL